MVGHAGGVPGFAAFEARIPEADLYVAMLCNTNNPPRELRWLASRLIPLALGETAVGTPAEIALSPAMLQEFAGTYQISPGASFVVIVKDAKLVGQLGPGRRTLKAVGQDEFTGPNEEIHFRFGRDAARHVTKVIVLPDAPGPDLEWPRVSPPTPPP